MIDSVPPGDTATLGWSISTIVVGMAFAIREISTAWIKRSGTRRRSDDPRIDEIQEDIKKILAHFEEEQLRHEEKRMADIEADLARLRDKNEGSP